MKREETVQCQLLHRRQQPLTFGGFLVVPAHPRPRDEQYFLGKKQYTESRHVHHIYTRNGQTTRTSRGALSMTTF
jgi:hypothetical protein